MPDYSLQIFAHNGIHFKRIIFGGRGQQTKKKNRYVQRLTMRVQTGELRLTSTNVTINTYVLHTNCGKNTKNTNNMYADNQTDR